MGSAGFGIPSLELLINSGIALQGIVTTPPRPQGRGLKIEESEIGHYAKKRGMGPVFTPEDLKDPTFLHTLSALEPDILIVVAYRILPEEVIAIPRLGALNLHASLLPKYRGPAPIQRAIEAGEKVTGVSVFQINRGIDTGAIILQKKISVMDDETTPQLYERLSAIGAEALHEAILVVQGGQPIVGEQDHTQATRAPKLQKKESVISWVLPAEMIYNKIRAYKPFPGTSTSVSGKIIGIEWAVPVEGNTGMPCGTICAVHDDSFEVQCGEGRLRILSLKPAGKRTMDVHAFLLGTPIKEGTTVG
jgi:methionyl-tRNA formyltransferase